MHQWVLDTKSSLEPLANAENAQQMSTYLRDQFQFYGIKSGERRAALKQLFTKSGMPSLEDLPKVIIELWCLPEREYQMVAVDLLIKLKNNLPISMATLLERCIVNKSWWDTVDMLATHIAGAMYLNYPEEFDSYIQRWGHADNLWLRRTTLLYQLKFKTKTDHQQLFSLIKYNLSDKEFFIQKAIGWTLREYSKTEPDKVIEFIEAESVEGLARREALKWLDKHRV